MTYQPKLPLTYSKFDVGNKCFVIEVYWCLHKAVWYEQLQPTNILLLQKRAFRILTSAEHLEHCKSCFKNLQIIMVFNQFSLIHLTTSKRILIFWNQKCHSSASNPIRCKIGSYTSCRLSRTQKCFAVAAIKLFNRLPEEIKSLPGGQFQCYMKRASQYPPMGGGGVGIHPLYSNPFFKVFEPFWNEHF